MNIQDKWTKKDYPIKILQFGEGVFIRAFVDYMIDVANEKGVFNGNVAIVKPRPTGNVNTYKEQNNLYTVVLRGKEGGKIVNDSRVITSVSKVLHCVDDYDEYMSLAKLETLEFIVSNTTESGIVLNRNDVFNGLPSTYPGKLTKFLYERYNAFGGAKDKGLIILPTELIEENGKKLKEYVLTLADIWGLPTGFKTWLKENNVFCSTLVDRIVTGYPSDCIDALYKELGYEDKLIDIGEPFALWVIESEKDISEALPLAKIGLPVILTDNLKPYRERKVRILNGAHTSSVLCGYLYGFDIVRNCMHDPTVGKFIRRVVMDEIVPQVNLPLEEVRSFAASVFERFENPYIDHSLLAISLNSVSKWKTRVLPSFKDYYKNNGKLPKLMTFSFAALLAFYSSNNLKEDGLYAKRSDGTEYVVHDDPAVLRFFAQNTGKPDFVELACKKVDFWGEDFTLYSGFTEETAYWYQKISTDIKTALQEVLI